MSRHRSIFPLRVPSRVSRALGEGVGTVLAVCGLVGCVVSAPASPECLRGATPLPSACRAAGVPYPPPAPSVRIDKKRRLLTLLSGQVPLKEYRVGLGGAPEGDKQRQGDNRTPEGTFYVCTRLKQSRFHRFVGLSYPSPAHAERGLKEGRINAAQRRAILTAWRQRRQPPWNTPLGGAVGIHGGGSGADWTLGCIAVENDQIEELFAVLPLGAPVEIR